MRPLTEAEMKLIEVGENRSKGGLEKITNIPELCFHPEHIPSKYIVLEPGTYRYTCPGCNGIIIFTVSGVMF